MNPMKILLVDDDDLILMMFGDALEADGHVVLKASNGLKALAVIAREKVHAVVTDIFMPEMEGIELIQAIRKIAPNTPIIAMSGGGKRDKHSDQYLAMARRFGANAIIHKPVDLDLFTATLASVMASVDTKNKQSPSPALAGETLIQSRKKEAP